MFEVIFVKNMHHYTLFRKTLNEHRQKNSICYVKTLGKEYWNAPGRSNGTGGVTSRKEKDNTGIERSKRHNESVVKLNKGGYKKKAENYMQLHSLLHISC